MHSSSSWPVALIRSGLLCLDVISNSFFFCYSSLLPVFFFFFLLLSLVQFAIILTSFNGHLDT